MKTAKITNHEQAGFYVDNGVMPLDIVRNCGKWVFIFIEDDTKEVFEMWKIINGMEDN